MSVEPLPKDHKNYKYTFAAWVEVFTIFQKYSNGKDDGISAQHECIYAGPDPSVVEEEDKKRLEELGWSISQEYDCYYRFT